MTSETAVAEAPAGSFAANFRASLPRYGTLIGLLVLIVVFSLLRPDTFPTWDNVLTVLTQASVLGIVAAGLTVCLILGEFDLSIGYTMTFGGVIAGVLLGDGYAIVAAIAIAIAGGLAIGVVNGVIVAYGRVNAFIATLGMGAITFGIVLAITGGEPKLLSNRGFIEIGQGKIGSIPTPVFISVAVIGLLWFFTTRTELGRRIDAVGGNAEAARLSGIRVPRTRLVGFLVSGIAAAAAGVVLAAQLGGAYSNSGDTYLLQAFTACFLGAVTLKESEFHVLGTVIGVLIMAVTFNGLAQLGVPAYWTNIAQGGILILAVLISSTSGRILPRRLRRLRLPRFSQSPTQ